MVVIVAVSNALDDLMQVIPAVSAAMKEPMRAGRVVRVTKWTTISERDDRPQREQTLM
jgi:hypothetical protein